MTQVVLSSGSTFTYGYDTSGQRIYRNLDGNKTWFVFDGLSTVMELDGTKKPTATFVPGISRTRLDLPEPLPEYYLHDGLGSVAQITDHLGNLIQEYRYNPFGDLQDGVTDKLNKYRFVGLAHEDALGLIYMNARWYEPQTGRFISKDIMKGEIINPQTTNPYLYVINNPVYRIDISGLGMWEVFIEKAENVIDWFGKLFQEDKKEVLREPSETEKKMWEAEKRMREHPVMPDITNIDSQTSPGTSGSPAAEMLKKKCKVIWDGCLELVNNEPHLVATICVPQYNQCMSEKPIRREQ